jgi:hypothetical protein
VLEGKALERRFKQIDWSKTDLLCHNTSVRRLHPVTRTTTSMPRSYTWTRSVWRAALFGNDIRGDLDSVSLFCGGRGKIKGVLESVKRHGMYRRHQGRAKEVSGRSTRTTAARRGRVLTHLPSHVSVPPARSNS